MLLALWPATNKLKLVLEVGVPEYRAIMAPLPAVIKLEELLPNTILLVVLEVASLKPAANLIAGVEVLDDVLVVATELFTVKLPVIVFTKTVPVDDRPE